MRALLDPVGIGYAFMGRFLGARPEDPSLYPDEGWLDFALVQKSDLFRQGSESILRGLGLGHRIALMCSEKDPFDCHRAVMIARHFDLNGVSAGHVLCDGRLMSQRELDQRIMAAWHDGQGDLFDTERDTLPEKERMARAYRKRNMEIAHRAW